MISRRNFAWLLSALCVALLVSCGPTAEEQATMTAAMWTATPTITPTPTPTPVPYDVELNVVDENGDPISGVLLSVSEMGGDEPIALGADGNYTMQDFPSDSMGIDAWAQGYTRKEETFALERGPNSLSLVLERAPFGILPAEACQGAGDLLYINDFEDGRADGWQGPFELVESEGQGIVMAATELEAYISYEKPPGFFDNTIWFIDVFMPRSTTYSILNPRFDSVETYYVGFTPRRDIDLAREYEGEYSHLSGPRGTPRIVDEWHTFAVAVYEDTLTVWIDGEQVITAAGLDTFGGLIAMESSSLIDPMMYDNIVMCNLTEPYVQPVVEDSE